MWGNGKEFNVTCYMLTVSLNPIVIGGIIDGVAVTCRRPSRTISSQRAMDVVVAMIKALGEVYPCRVTAWVGWAWGLWV
jgi:ABC-type methionine transport system permease subunit